MHLYNKKKAMSFAELITVMVIIGVVSSLTIPGLRKHSQMVEFASLAKKAYANIEDIMDNAIITHGGMKDWDFRSNSTFDSMYVSPFIKTSGGASTDGMTYAVKECDGTFCHVQVDINAGKLPNLPGKDQFKFKVDKDEENVVPDSFGGTDLLRKNNWKFTKELWEKSW